MKTTVLVSLLFVFLAMYTIVLAKTPKFVPLVDTNAGVSTGSNLVSNLPISPRRLPYRWNAVIVTALKLRHVVIPLLAKPLAVPN